VAVPETSFACLAGDELSERSEAGAFELFRDLLTREDHVRPSSARNAGIGQIRGYCPVYEYMLSLR
jgi:hypothetical protein